MVRDVLSVAYIDNREYDIGGPYEYLDVFNHSRDAIYLVPTLLFPINQWLIDGLLVSSASNLVAQASNLDHHFSCIVVMLFIL